MSQEAANSAVEQLSTSVFKITGTAGAGKSYLARQRIGEWLQEDEDRTPSDVLVVSFLNSHVDDVERKLRTSARSSEHPLPRYFLTGAGERGTGATVSTLNSVCHRLACKHCGESTLNIIDMGNEESNEYFQTFFEEHAPQLQYDHRNKRPLKLAREDRIDEASLGNRLIEAYNYLRATARPLKRSQLSPIPFDVELHPDQVITLMEAWEDYKRQENIYQHHDYVHLVYEHELVPEEYALLFIDEFQDLSPIQYGVYKNWRDSGTFRKIIISGDPAQSIYQFRGGNPRYLMETPCDNHVSRTESRRCPPAILQTAAEVIAPLDIPSDLTSHEEAGGGVFKHRYAREQRDLALLARNCVEEYGEVMILARTNADVGKIAYTLTDNDLPYTSLNTCDATRRQGIWYWDDPAPRLLEVLRKCKYGERIPLSVVESLLKHASREEGEEEIIRAAHDSRLRREVSVKWGNSPLGEDDDVPPNVLCEWVNVTDFTEIPNRMQLPQEQRDVVLGALAAGHDISASNLRIGTMHASKGTEANAVIICNGYTKTQLDRFHNGNTAPEERRLYYVAATRAKEGLYVLHDWNGSAEFPPFERI